VGLRSDGERMDIDGDIRVWKDGEKVRARLCADGPEGADRRGGIRATGADSTTNRASARTSRGRNLWRRAGLRRDHREHRPQEGTQAPAVMAPSAFSKRGLASYIARGELMKRRRRRRALARAGQPVGAKAIGPVPPGGPPRPIRRRRRWRRLGRWARPLIPAALATTSAALDSLHHQAERASFAPRSTSTA